MGRLFWKFFLCILLAQLAATVGIGGTFWLRDQARQRTPPIDIESSPPAELLIETSAIALRHGGMPALRDMLGVMKRHTVFVLDERGAELLGRPVSAELRARAESELENGAVRAVTAPGGERLLLFVPRGYRAGDGAAQGTQEAARSEAPAPFGRGMGRRAPIIAAVVASLLFAALLAWYFSRPIRALRSAFEAAAEGDLAPRFGGAAKRRGDELNDLGRDFDRMSGQLRALMDGQRRLLHDVSHELRSPLARLQAAIGLAHQQPDKIATSLERIERESVRIDRLVGELLTLSRIEAAPDLPKTELIDMQEMMEQMADDARFEAGQSGGADIVLSGAVEAAVRGAPDLLWRAIENVVRNAAKHGGAGGVVDISLHADAQWVHVDVCDRGPGMAEVDLTAIFEPFFRAAPQNGSADGYGLGLAIAQRVVQAHGGTIVAANRDGGGLRVAVTLPLAP